MYKISIACHTVNAGKQPAKKPDIFLYFAVSSQKENQVRQTATFLTESSSGGSFTPKLVQLFRRSSKIKLTFLLMDGNENTL